MCGIIGYTGMQNATKILVNGLSNLEYRGYDSAGVSIFSNGLINTIKAKGRLQNLADKLAENGNPSSDCGIGHTRWATHGEPSDINSHPHSTGKVALVHNGIIENYLDIKKFLENKGYLFESQTDTETAAKLIDFFYKGDPFEAITKALDMIDGAYAFGILFEDMPETIYAVRKGSPLIVGIGGGENYIASDIPAILEYTRDYYLLEEMEIAIIKPDSIEIFDLNKNPLTKEICHANWDVSAAQKDGFPHFMLKEMHEQPKALTETIHPRIRKARPDFTDDGLPENFFAKYNKIHIVACGTAMYAGMVGKNLIERLARISVEVEVASEFRYKNPVLSKDDLFIVISQSGETADSLAALRLAKAEGIDTLAIVNVTGSSIARESDYVLHTYAGPEIAVASTKAYSVQLGLLYLISIAIAASKGCIDAKTEEKLTRELMDTVKLTKEVLKMNEYIKELAPSFSGVKSLFYLGRGLDYAMALEGALKLKEISYIHSEAYAAGEIKHGTISLIEDGVPVIALVTQEELIPKMISNIKETKARKARVIVVTCEDFDISDDVFDEIIKLPKVNDLFMPILSVITLQMFAYHISVVKECDVDKPRNLAKSVTVE